VFAKVAGNHGGLPQPLGFEGEGAFVGADPCVCPKDCKQSTWIRSKQSYLSKQPATTLSQRGDGDIFSTPTEKAFQVGLLVLN
jgi:hypothetical protein